MRVDDSLQFDHPSPHPSVVYAPAHLIDNPVPTWAKVAFGLAVVFFVAARFVSFRDHRRVAAALVAGSLGSFALAWVGGSDVGTHIGPLPAQTHDMGLGTPTPGDQDELYVSQADALAAARKTSEDQHDDPARARTVAYRWGHWPERFSVALHGTKDRDMFPKDAGWSNADLTKVDAWASREYGISAKDEGGSGTDHLVPTTNPVEALSDREVGITGPGTKAIEGADHYECVIEIKDLRTNDLGQPLRATPVRLVCIDSWSTGALTQHDLLYPKRLSSSTNSQPG